MPHMNTCDLSVFPAMSRRHCALERASGGLHVLKEDEVWTAAEEVWRKLPNSKIASAYAHAYCIAEEVVKRQGDNKFLGERSGLSFGVRKRFHETAVGITRRDGKKIAAPKRIRELKQPNGGVAAFGDVAAVGGVAAFVNVAAVGGVGDVGDITAGVGVGVGDDGRVECRVGIVDCRDDPPSLVEEIAVERETDGDDVAAVGGVGDVGDVTAVGGVGDVGVGIVDCRGGGRFIMAGGGDPPSLVPEVTDMARRHALARAHALGLPPPPSLPYPPRLEPKDEMIHDIGLVEEA